MYDRTTYCSCATLNRIILWGNSIFHKFNTSSIQHTACSVKQSCCNVLMREPGIYQVLQDCMMIIYTFIIYTREKSFCKTWFQVGMELKKVQKQGRDERMQEDYLTSAKKNTRCRVVFLRSFISALFLYFFQLHPYLKSSFTETFFSLVSVLFSGVSKPTSN